MWDAASARRYDTTYAAMSTEEALGPQLDLLTDLAGDGPVLELAVGTGRVGIPLARRGIPVRGIELSPHMVAELHRKVDADLVPTTVGDMANTRLPDAGDYALVILVFNTLGNLRTQDEQVACFANAAAHLRAGGRFVIELGVPALRRLPPTALGAPFDVTDEHVGVDTYDPVTQQATSHHFTREADGSYRRGTHNYRYVWPSECDLMARLAGMQLEARYAGWNCSPFTADSTSHVSVWRTRLD